MYSGANNPLYLVRGGELIHYRADKMPVAIHYKMLPFTLHTIELQKGDAFYIFSDGYADQFGGPKQKKFMSMQLKETLVAMAGKPMLKQGERLNEIFEEWRGDSPQVDDVTLIGVDTSYIRTFVTVPRTGLVMVGFAALKAAVQLRNILFIHYWKLQNYRLSCV